jgi:hypothetical protein
MTETQQSAKNLLINKLNNNKCDINDPILFYKKLLNKPKNTGIKIYNRRNEYKNDPFKTDVFIKQPDYNVSDVSHNDLFLENLDLNLNHYSRNDLFKLFNVREDNLTENILKECKKIANKMHPDKSKLNEKYFIFFSNAYQKMVDIYIFSNKILNKDTNTKEYLLENNDNSIEPILKPQLTPKEFSNLFNTQFDKYKSETPTENNGYEDWLKSEEDIMFMPHLDNKDQMLNEINKYKNQVKTITKYNGIQSANGTYAGNSLIESNNFTSTTLFNNNELTYTDLKQAYIESVIPITEDDYNKIPKFNSLKEYEDYRNNKYTIPLDETTSFKKLYFDNEPHTNETNALAFYYAKQCENANT